MPTIATIDKGKAFDWGRTSSDYATHRPGPPPSFYERLHALGVGRAGQRILDLGTGTGLLARQLARQGADVVGVDIAPEQIAAATRLAQEEGLSARFAVAPAETTGQQDASFDAIIANQCWLYFDKARVIAEVRRLLAPDGVLVTSHFSWMPRLNAIARQSEEMVLRFSPDWGGADWHGIVLPMPKWAEQDFDLVAMFWYDEAIPFTRDSWRGRMRACRGIGASLPPEDVERFDREHDALLRRIAPDDFTILHRLDAHVLRPKSGGGECQA
ncbi:MAG: class I SAM-dependent methyltransferase [Proteobacteria bacterium]|nr:class I SAM-dependent methyltransferase [Pseudomonadota bacterium]